jgi:mono/diheme cytochrome c family protein
MNYTNQTSRVSLRHFLLLGVSVLLLVALAACGGQANTTENPAPPAENSTNNTPTEIDMPEPTAASEDSAPTDAEPPAEMTVSFSADVFPILQSRCINCHGGDRTNAELVMRSYEDLMAGSENGQVIIPGDAENSLLVQLVSEQKMPKRGPKLTPVQVQTIADWVNEGANNN